MSDAAIAQATPNDAAMTERVKPCTTCHGPEGRASSQGYLPRIAGKPAGYLHQQLISFREGRRHYPLMTGLLEHLSDDYLREMADYFGSLDLPYPPPQLSGADPTLLRQGEAMVRRGDPARQIPACADCHGERLTGQQPAIPGLLGLPRDYLNAQLGAWKTGQRRARAPDCMAKIAHRLDPADIAAVSTWLASQRMPVPASAASPSTKALPMDCGLRTPAPMPALASAKAIDAGREAQVKQGEYLARAGNCAACHTAPAGMPFAGGRGVDTPFGRVYSSNLTPDRATGIGAWSTDDFWRAMHQGLSRDGRRLSPAFPYPNYTRLTRADSDALLAYLHSLPAVNQANRGHELRYPFGTQWALGLWRALYFKPQTFAPEPGRSEAWNRGAYLVNGLGHCDACHAPRNPLGATRQTEGLTGGPVGTSRWYAPSLASPQEAGVQDWRLDEIVSLLKTGQSTRGSVIGPMAEVVFRSTQHLSDSDLSAIATYLKTLPLQTGRAASSSVAPPSARGEEIYRLRCADCHGRQGEGRPGLYPSLAGNRALRMANPENLIATVLNGAYAPATAGHPRPYGMPPFGHELDDEAIAAVISYVRLAWGNNAPAVSAQQILRSRGQAR